MDEKVLSFDYSCVPENLKKWCNFEELLFNSTRENLESAKLLFRELYFSFRDVSYHLVIHIGNLFPLKASRISDFFSFLPPTKLRFENSFFAEYLVKKKLLNKTCLLDEIKSTQTWEEMEQIYDAISPEYLICNDDFDRYVEVSADKKIMLQKIIYKKEKYDHLAFAALLGSVRIFKFLLANQMCISRDTTINAIKGGNDEIIQILQQQETSFDWCLKSSIEYHNNEIALWLIENYKCDEIDARFCTECFNTLALCYFVERGIDLEKKDRFGCTPFVNAAKNGHLPIAMHLLNSGALLESEEFHGWNALNIAITYRSMDMIKYLISCHSNIESKDHFGSTPLIRAADFGYLEIVECLIEKGANINASDSCGYTALISAAINGKGLIVKYLLEKGANINQYDNDGFTPLMHAVQNSNIKVIKILLDNGADKGAVSKRGYTAMSLSSSEKVSQVLSQKQKFVIPFVKMTHEEIKASRGITPEDEQEDDKGESGVIYGLLSNWNPFV